MITDTNLDFSKYENNPIKIKHFDLKPQFKLKVGLCEYDIGITIVDIKTHKPILCLEKINNSNINCNVYKKAFLYIINCFDSNEPIDSWKIIEIMKIEVSDNIECPFNK